MPLPVGTAENPAHDETPHLLRLSQLPRASFSLLNETTASCRMNQRSQRISKVWPIERIVRMYFQSGVNR